MTARKSLQVRILKKSNVVWANKKKIQTDALTMFHQLLVVSDFFCLQCLKQEISQAEFYGGFDTSKQIVFILKRQVGTQFTVASYSFNVLKDNNLYNIHCQLTNIMQKLFEHIHKKSTCIIIF